jgi:membrane-bound lytic murein transglycosylase D
MNRTIAIVLVVLAVLFGSAASASDVKRELPGGPARDAASPVPVAVSGAARPAAAPSEAPAAHRELAKVAASADGDDAEEGTTSAADSADEPEIEQEVQAESAELEQVRAAEERARLAEPAGPEDPAARAAARLGLESPLLKRLRDAFGREAVPVTPDGKGRIAGLPEIDHDLRQLQAEYDIPIEVNDRVIAYVRFFQSPVIRKHFVKWLGRSHKYVDVFRRILREQGLPEDTFYLAMIESGFANHATSRARAVGAWQFIPATGKRMGLSQDFWVDERRDPEKAAYAAAKFLKELYRQTGDWKLAWAGYNAGVGKIYKAQRRGERDFWAMTRGRVLRAETKGYVPKLMAAAIVAKHAAAFGFGRDEIVPERWQKYEEVSIPHATPLATVAAAAGVPEKALLDLNPELRRTCTPPRPYTIKLPDGQGQVFARNWPAAAEGAGKLAFAQHRVARGESLKAIARTYAVDQSTIARMNGLRPGRRIKPGTEIVVPLNALARTQSAAFASAERPEPERQVRAHRARGRGRLVAKAGAVVSRRFTAAEARGRTRATVQVRAGDSLWGIAQKFGVAVEEICRWNGIRNPRRFKLQVGRELVVYRRPNEAA